jgi:hypothetical protein
MSKIIVALLMVGVIFSGHNGWAEPPTQVAGITLGASISQYDNLIRKDSIMPIRHSEYLSEAETQYLEGYKNGYIVFGTCREPGRIIRIKLKYAHSDRAFFDELLERFKQKFGKPAEWKGDPFQTLITWKWSFTDKNNNRINMILQHYSGDDEEYTSGNSLRLSMPTLMENERKCYEAKNPEPPSTHEKLLQDKASRVTDKDYKRFIPE